MLFKFQHFNYVPSFRNMTVVTESGGTGNAFGLLTQMELKAEVYYDYENSEFVTTNEPANADEYDNYAFDGDTGSVTKETWIVRLHTPMNWTASDQDLFPPQAGIFASDWSVAPSFNHSYPETSEVGSSGFKLTAQLNEPGKVYYVVLADGATAPSVSEVKAGTGSDSATAAAYGSMEVSAVNTDSSDTVTGLNAETAYDIYLVAEDDESAPNVQSTVTSLDITTGSAAAVDETAPSFVSSYPKTSSVANDSLTITAQLNEPGTVYYVVLEDGSAEPSISEIKAGGGYGGATAIASGSIDVSVAETDCSAAISGLTDGTAYDIYLVAEDDESTPNVQSSVTTLAVTTGSRSSEQAPEVPALISPAEGETISLPLTLTWGETADPDGDTVSYAYYVCENKSFAGCDAIDYSTSSSSSRHEFTIGFPGMNKDLIAADRIPSKASGLSSKYDTLVFWAVFLLLSLVTAGIISTRKKSRLFLIVLLTAAVLAIGCQGGGGSGDNDTDDGSNGGGNNETNQISAKVSDLSSGTTYYWKVAATDENGEKSISSPRSFTVE